MLPSRPHCSTLGFLLSSTFINDLYEDIHFSDFLLFGDDLKSFNIIKSAEDCKLLQSDTDFTEVVH
jgi:hypothetical protein